MLKHFFLNKWTLILVTCITSAILMLLDYTLTAKVLLPAVISFIIIKGVYKNETALGIAYCSGVSLGLAALFWIYALALAPLMLLYMFGPLQGRSFKLALAMTYGIATPFWVYLPYYLYTHYIENMDFITLC